MPIVWMGLVLPGLLLLAGCSPANRGTPEDFAALRACTEYGLDDFGVLVVALLRGLDGPESMDEPVEFAAGSPVWLEEEGNRGRLFGEITGDDRSDGLQPGERATFDLLVTSTHWSGSVAVTLERLVDGTLRLTGEMDVFAPDCRLTATDIDLVLDPDDDAPLRPAGMMEIISSRRISGSRLALFVPGSSGTGPPRTVRGTLQMDGTSLTVVTGTYAGEPTSFRVPYEWRR